MNTNKAHEAKKKMKAEQNQEFRPQVEKVYKRIKQTMSWIVGIAFGAILILPEFNSPAVDQVTRVLFLAGISVLVIFIFIEFIGNEIKTFLDKIIHD